jgi:beta-lactamase class A
MRLLFLATLAFAASWSWPATIVAQQGAASPPASAAPLQPAIELARSRIDTMLRTGHADSAWFSASFLAQVSAGQVDAVIASLTTQLGAYQSVEYTPTRFVARFAKGTDDVLIHLDSDGKIDGLIFKPPAIAGASLDDALAGLQRMAGTLSYVIVEEGRSERAALNASTPLAVGSAFKLAVLNALLDRIANGSRRWSDVVPLQAQWKSLPSGVLRSWPDGTPLTLATYAAEMISISDNTAADALVRIVGQAALEPYAAANQPIPTTREMFVLKSDEGANLAAAYLAAASPSARAAVLERADAMPLPAANHVLTKPQPALEWHFSVRQLCKLMERVANLPLMSINPGVADPADFRHVAYKGGSDTGVVNLTTMVTTHRGTKICFAATLNDSAREVDEAAFELAYSGVLAQLARL